MLGSQPSLRPQEFRQGCWTARLGERATVIQAHGHTRVRTHSLRADQYGLVSENLQHQFRSGESAVSIRTDTDLILTGVWPSDDDDLP